MVLNMKKNNSVLFIRLDPQLKRKFRHHVIDKHQTMSENIREYIEDMLSFEEAVKDTLNPKEGENDEQK